MARGKRKSHTFNFNILNIKLNTPEEFANDKEKYKNLIDNVKGRKLITKLRGDKHCIMRTLFHDPEKPEIMHGEFTAFTMIETDEYLNIDTMDIEEGLEIDQNAFPNPKGLPFYFFAEFHRMIVPSKGKISLNSITKHIQESFSAVIGEDEEVEVIQQQSHDVFEKILSAPYVRKLEISLTPTNNDPIADEFEDMFDEDVKENEIKRMDTIFWARGGKTDSFANSKIIKAQLGLAAENGQAIANIYDAEGNKETINTSKHPQEHSLIYNEVDDITWKVAEYLGARYARGTEAGNT